jgi:hypothetical protein
MIHHSYCSFLSDIVGLIQPPYNHESHCELIHSLLASYQSIDISNGKLYQHAIVSIYMENVSVIICITGALLDDSAVMAPLLLPLMKQNGQSDLSIPESLTDHAKVKFKLQRIENGLIVTAIIELMMLS